MLAKIGIQRCDYPEARNILSLNRDVVDFTVDHVEILPTHPFFGNSLKASDYFREFSSNPDPFKQISCYHYFNTLPVSKVPFVCTFETSLPRWWNADAAVEAFGWEVMASQWCRNLFAISENAYQIFYDSLKNCSASMRSKILEKTEVLYPPQALGEFKKSKLDSLSDPRIAFVGGDFLRKGGFELLLAFEELIRSGADIHLTIVSELKVQGGQDLVWNFDHEARLRRAKEVIAAYPNQITYFPTMPNPEVLNLLHNSHVLVLPSFGDTFGYVVLEAHACGTPTITTDIRAFPELNSSETGWVAQVPVDNQGKLDKWHHSFPDISSNLVEQLKEILSQLTSLQAIQYRNLADACMKRIATHNNPVQIGGRVLKAYGLS